MGKILKNLSILQKFLFINLVVFIFIIIITFFYLGAIKKNLINEKQKNHTNIITQDYYLKAITENFTPIKDYIFLVFSNDIEYAKNMLEGDNIWFVEPEGIDSYSYTSSEKDDLALLSLCDNNIITNSTYSWWGAYLSKNKNKKIICPTNWLAGPSFMNGNHFPPNWINIDNKN